MAKCGSMFLALHLVLSCARCLCLGVGNCPRQEFFKDFNITRFAGHWYEIERSFYLMELLSTCTTIDLDQINSRQTNVTVTTFNRWTGTINHVSGVATVSRRDPSAFTYRRTSHLPNAIAKWLPGSGYYQLLSTDYENYAVIWSCSNAGIVNADGIWIFSRQLDLDVHSRHQVYELLKSRHIDVDRFTLTNKNCTEPMPNATSTAT